MMVADYFSKKCQACKYVEEETNILDVIKMRYVIRKYNVRTERHRDKVREWMDWADGRIPSIQVEGNGKLIRKIGVGGLEELAEKVGTWIEKTEDRRRSDVGILENPIDIGKFGKTEDITEYNLEKTSEEVYI